MDKVAGIVVGLIIAATGLVVGMIYMLDQENQSMSQELADIQLEVKSLRSAVGIEVEYLGVLRSLIGKLQEYNQFNNYTPEQISDTTLMIVEQAAIYRDAGITPALIMAVMEQESGFDPFAVSSVQAVGLMQVRRAAAQETLERLGYIYSVELMQDPILNTKVGTEYLVWLHKLFMSEGIESRNEFTYTLTAYNWGPTAAFALIAGDRGDNMLPDLKYAARVAQLRGRYEESGLE